MTGAPYPVFPVKLFGFQEIHAAFLMKAAHRLQEIRVICGDDMKTVGNRE
jgi:hypothetical protein